MTIEMKLMVKRFQCYNFAQRKMRPTAGSFEVEIYQVIGIPPLDEAQDRDFFKR
jgi:hypothetical protein